MVRKTERLGYVKTLRSLAKSCGVEMCHEEAGRDKVTDMMAAIRASTAKAAVKREAERVLRSCHRNVEKT